jgi:hypothetical protein
MTSRDDSGESYADRVLREAMAGACGGLDPELATEAIANIVRAVSAQAAALAGKDYTDLSAAEVSRALSHAMKAGDVLFRLKSFAAGAPDSRRESVSRDVLSVLTDAQAAQVAEWIEQAGKKETR